MAACSSNELPTSTGEAKVALSAENAPAVAHPRRLIVRLKSSPTAASERATQILLPYGAEPAIDFEKVFQGFVVEGLSSAAEAALAKNPLVEYVEVEGLSYPNDVQTLTEASQWGLDRIDQHFSPLDGLYTYPNSGAGVHIYIVDSGIRGGHVEFSGRVGNGTCKVSFTFGCSPTIDQRGHGTAVASQAAGTVAGVAKGAIIHPVRIDDASGGARDGDVIDGLEWILSYRMFPAVVNMSYGDNSGTSPGSFAIRDALQSLVNNGIVVVKSAGNADRDAYLYRPNRVDPAFVVAAAGWDPIGQALYRMYYSNYGSTVDIFAPGDGTYAAGNGWDGDYTTFGGTSGASPFVAGAVAQILGAYPYLTPAEVDYWIKSNSSPGVMFGINPGDPNLFISRW